MLMFCHRHGITVNKEAIWRAVKQHDMVVASVLKHFGPLRSSSQEPEQQSLNLSPVSSWPYKGS